MYRHKIIIMKTRNTLAATCTKRHIIRSSSTLYVSDLAICNIFQDLYVSKMLLESMAWAKSEKRQNIDTRVTLQRVAVCHSSHNLIHYVFYVCGVARQSKDRCRARASTRLSWST